MVTIYGDGWRVRCRAYKYDEGQCWVLGRKPKDGQGHDLTATIPYDRVIRWRLG